PPLRPDARSHLVLGKGLSTMLKLFSRRPTGPSPRRPGPRPPYRLTLEPLEERLTLSIQPVADTTGYPYSAAVQLDVNNHGHTITCSGAMIDPTHVLTAAHCLYDPALGIADTVTVFAGRNGENVTPFGAVSGVRWAVHPLFVSGRYAGEAPYDLAV